MAESIAEQCENRMKAMNREVSDRLHADFAEQLQLPIEECYRRQNVALANLLDRPQDYRWGRFIVAGFPKWWSC